MLQDIHNIFNVSITLQEVVANLVVGLISGINYFCIL